MIPFDLMLIVDPRHQESLDALAAIRVHGERIAVQLRAKDAPDTALLVMARELAAAQPPMSRLIVNDRPHVARAISADGAHVPESGGSIADVRAALVPGTLVGASCHDAAGVARRAAEGADYVLLGPIGDVPGKPALGLDAFAAIARASTVPVVALGGIATAEDADRALAHGAAAVAVQRALVDADWIPTWLSRR